MRKSERAKQNRLFLNWKLELGVNIKKKKEGEQFNSGQSYIFLTISVTMHKVTVNFKKKIEKM